MTIKDEGMAVERAQLEALRRGLGARLAVYRTAAGLSQPELGQALGRTRSMVSKVENGARAMSAQLWELADELCSAEGALVAEHTALAQAEADYRDRCRAQRRAVRQAAAHAQAQALAASLSPASALSDVLPRNGRDEQSEGVEGGGLVNDGLAEELRAVVVKLVRAVGRREAIRLLASVLTAVGLPGLDLDPDETTRLVQAVEVPRRVDEHVITNLAAMLAYCKRLEDSLGPREVLDTVMAQHRLVHRLLVGDCPDHLRKPLHLVDSNIACTIGGYLVDMGQPDEGKSYFDHARHAAHDARNSAYAAYAAANTSFAAFDRANTPTALDTAAAARSLAARTSDVRLKAFAEEQAAAAYALDGQYGPYMAACDRAHDFLTHAHGSAPDSPAYWVHHGSIDSQRSLLLSQLDKPEQALDAAQTALAQYDPTYIGRYTLCQIRLGHALVLSNEITEAARVLAEAASHAHLYPRLTQELHTARKLMQPWHHTPTVKTLDEQLRSCGLHPHTGR